MTIIIGLETPDGVYMGADSVLTNGWVTRTFAFPKVIQKGDLTIGVAGQPRAIQLIQFADGIQWERGETFTTDLEYLVKGVVNPIQSLLQAASLTTSESGVVGQSSEFLLAHRGGLYVLDTGFNLARVSEGLMSIGVAADIALGAMSALSNLPPKVRLMRSLEICGQLSVGVKAPYQIYHGGHGA